MMLATASTDRRRPPIDIHTLAGTHAFDLKLDGIRARIEWDGKAARIFSRTGQRLEVQYPEVAEACRSIRERVVLDGEIVSNDRKFSTLARRPKRPVPGDIRLTPCRFFAFDLLDRAGTDLRGQQWSDRRDALESMADALDRAGMSVTPVFDDPDCLDVVLDQGWEGLIAKRRTSRYRDGKSPDWVKFKRSHSVSCLPYRYLPGDSGQEFGKMLVSLLDGGKPVDLGPVGTGFNAAEVKWLKARIDARETFVVEVACAGISYPEGKPRLRCPSFKGERVDVPAKSCTVSQLDAIPRY